jgi:uncharacterized membrane protein
LEGSGAVVEANKVHGGQPRTDGVRRGQDGWLSAMYAVVLAASIAVWLIAVRAPLWLDETGSYWQISAGFSQIWPRRFATLSFPAYAYILWLWTRIFGTGEMVLRVLSILAMLAATYLLYRAARELFDRDCAMVAAITFCLNPIVVFAAIDVRPYAFGVLATNAAIYIVLRLRRNNSNWLAALLGFASACILYFHLLFATVLPALILCFFLVKWRERKIFWRQLSVALGAFALACLPLIPQVQYLFHTAGSHVYERAPDLVRLIASFAPGYSWGIFGLIALLVFAITTMVGTIRARSDGKTRSQIGNILFCATLALVPILILYGVSVSTSIHLFISRHRLVAVPGIALCWALFLNSFRPRMVRLLFCVAFVAATAYFACTSPTSREHGYSWKSVLDFVEKNASVDDAPVLICSDFPESDFATMPVDSPKDSIFFAQLSYYQLTVPVVPLPRALNGEAMRVGGDFLKQAAEKHERFLALSFKSQPTLKWLTESAAGSHTVRNLGKYNGITVLEFVPRGEAAPASDSNTRPLRP